MSWRKGEIICGPVILARLILKWVPTNHPTTTDPDPQ